MKFPNYFFQSKAQIFLFVLILLSELTTVAFGIEDQHKIKHFEKESIQLASNNQGVVILYAIQIVSHPYLSSQEFRLVSVSPYSGQVNLEKEIAYFENPHHSVRDMVMIPDADNTQKEKFELIFKSDQEDLQYRFATITTSSFARNVQYYGDPKNDVLFVGYDTFFKRLVGIQQVKAMYYFCDIKEDGTATPVLPIQSKTAPVLYAVPHDLKPIALTAASSNFTLHVKQGFLVHQFHIPFPNPPSSSTKNHTHLRFIKAHFVGKSDSIYFAFHIKNSTGGHLMSWSIKHSTWTDIMPFEFDISDFAIDHYHHRITYFQTAISDGSIYIHSYDLETRKPLHIHQKLKLHVRWILVSNPCHLNCVEKMVRIVNGEIVKDGDNSTPSSNTSQPQSGSSSFGSFSQMNNNQSPQQQQQQPQQMERPTSMFGAPFSVFGYEFPAWSLMVASFFISMAFGIKGILFMLVFMLLIWCYRQGGSSQMFLNPGGRGPILPTTSTNTGRTGGVRTIGDYPSNQGNQ